MQQRSCCERSVLGQPKGHNQPGGRFLSPILGDPYPAGNLGRASGGNLGRASRIGALRKLPFGSEAQQVWNPLIQIIF